MAKSAMDLQAAVIVVPRWRTSVAPQRRPLSQPLETDFPFFHQSKRWRHWASWKRPVSRYNHASAVVKILGALMDQRPSVDQHIDEICKTCYHHIRAFRHMRESLPDDVARTVACSIVTSRIDYCNSLFIGMSDANFAKL
jgi:hypothetical protein